MGDEVIGSAELKYREMAIYPEKEHWLGGVFVIPKHRGKGIAARLVESVVETARALDVAVLHIQTQRLDGGLYRALGWQATEQTKNRGLDVLVMERAL
jgi:GNAT superfamily N-acetyltransferase